MQWFCDSITDRLKLTNKLADYWNFKALGCTVDVRGFADRGKIAKYAMTLVSNFITILGKAAMSHGKKVLDQVNVSVTYLEIVVPDLE